VKCFFTKEFRLTFAGALHELLERPKSIKSWPIHQDYHKALKSSATLIMVNGRLPLREHNEAGETIVGIELAVWPNWMNTLPFASTDAPFIRSELDWHVPWKSCLCYALDQEWRWKLDEMWNSDAGPDAIIAVSSTWCIRNIDSLITRHLHGYRYGITKWPKQWGQWSHGTDGIREFEIFAQNMKAA
jgi:hypothetical protein